jgi:DNA adenine methylase
MRMPQPLPYQGSKRAIASEILTYFPADVEELVEPFAGSAAVTIAAASLSKAKRFHLNDINEPLMQLWDSIINSPEGVLREYEAIWKAQLHESNEYYNRIRSEFNTTHQPSKFLYVLARCVKGSVRYNSKGEFNQGPDKRRLGKHPITMQKEIMAVSHLLKNRTILTSDDYLNIFNKAKKGDLLYLDPPYQGVCSRRDTRYFNGIKYEEFVNALRILDEKHVPFILSYDGRTGDKIYGKGLPLSLGLKRIEIHAGRSTQATLLGRDQITYESLYLSTALMAKLESKEQPILA